MHLRIITRRLVWRLGAWHGEEGKPQRLINRRDVMDVDLASEIWTQIFINVFLVLCWQRNIKDTQAPAARSVPRRAR